MRSEAVGAPGSWRDVCGCRRRRSKIQKSLISLDEIDERVLTGVAKMGVAQAEE